MHKGIFSTAFLGMVFIVSQSQAQDPTVQELAEKIESLQYFTDIVWTTAAAALVFLMQVGFLLLEAGTVRSKNSINVAQKNIADFVIAITVFWMLGFGVMFGSSVGGWFGSDHFFLNHSDDNWTYVFFYFQAVFCGTAATILSGAVAERMKFHAYLWISVTIAVVIYPVFGHWAWGSLLLGSENAGWLEAAGFIDFAGSTVVHSVGGWIALAGIIVVGPRLGRFNNDGSSNRIHGHSPVLATAGALMLWIGWIGFNGGSTTAASSDIGHIVLNTMIAGAVGGTVALFIGWFSDYADESHAHPEESIGEKVMIVSTRIWRPERTINGSLGGLVAITAGCYVASTWGAAMMGVCAAIVVHVSTWYMERKGWDDVVGAVPVHGFCGVLGTLGVAFLADESSLVNASMWSQLWVQAQGVISAFVWAFGLGFAAFKAIDWITPGGIRVSVAHEEEGLNSAEHGTLLGSGVLQNVMLEFAQGKGDLNNRLKVDLGDEAGETALIFNKIMDRLQAELCAIGQGVSKMESQITRLSQTATELDQNSSGTLEKTASVDVMTNDFSDKVTDISDNSASLNCAADGIASKTSRVAENIRHSSEISQKLGDTFKAIEARIKNSGQVATEALQFSKNAGSSVKTLGESAEKISQMAESIRQIADQTNLLALNATIESARAGQAGKGFAVVASEVKNLASAASKAAEEISIITESVSSDTDETIDVISQIADFAERIDHSIQQTCDEISGQIEATHSMIENMQLTAETASQIAEETDGVKSMTGSVKSATSIADDETRAVLEEIAEMHELAKENSKRSENVNEVATELKDVVNTVGGSLKKLGLQ